MPRYRLRLENGELDLPLGELLIGRGAECQLVLDEALVSRRHARLVISADRVTVEDLGSRNGILVNGTRERGMRTLGIGDRVQLGSKELLLVEATPGPATLVPRPEPDRRPTHQDMSMEEPTHAGTMSGLLFSVASKLLAQGKVDEATRLFGNAFQELRAQLQSSASSVSPILLTESARHALALVSASGKREVLDIIFDLYRIAGKVLDGATIDSIHSTIRATKYPAGTALRAYVEAMRGASEKMSPAERFRLNRLEGLVAVASTFR